MVADDVQKINKLSHQLGYSISLEESREQIKKIILKEDHCAYTAVVNNIVIGWIHAFISLAIESRPFVEIGGLVVDEGHRGKGIGNKLVEKVKEWTIYKKVDFLRVRSNVTRLQTHHFYNKIGFEEIKEQKVFSLNIGN